MSLIPGFSITFPDLEGTDRQIWYAESLRQKYVYQNESRFREIEEHTILESDMRDTDYKKTDYFHTWEMEFSDEEAKCLFSESAVCIISTFRERFQKENEEFKSGENKRKELGLPLTNQLVYYPNKRNEDSKMNVLRFRIIEEHKEMPTLEIELENMHRVKILLPFFKQMQSSNFIKAMAKEAESILKGGLEDD